MKKTFWEGGGGEFYDACEMWTCLNARSYKLFNQKKVKPYTYLQSNINIFTILNCSRSDFKHYDLD